MKKLLILLPLLCCAFGPPAGVSESTIPGLQGWWTLNGNITDSSGLNQQTGTIVGTTTYSNAVVMQGLNFNGVTGAITNIGLVSSYSFVHNTLIFTISAWLKLDSTTARSGIIGISGSTFGKGFYFLYETFGSGFGSKGLGFVGLNSSGIAIISANTGTNTITDTTSWHHVLVESTSAANSISFYVDNVLQTTYYQTSFTYVTNGNQTATMAIGAINNTFTLPFTGTLDDVRIYNRALTTAEISQLYNGGQGSQH